jgi:hypothetical protein
MYDEESKDPEDRWPLDRINKLERQADGVDLADMEAALKRMQAAREEIVARPDFFPGRKRRKLAALDRKINKLSMAVGVTTEQVSYSQGKTKQLESRRKQREFEGLDR